MTDIYGYAAAAPLYRAAGWMQVIPLPEGHKTPPPSGFTGRSRKPVTDEQVQVWSQATPNANTGIVIPEGVLVLDIDAEQGHRVKADGAKGISELSQELGALPATWSSTAHGIDSPARHLFYKVPEGLAWKGGAIEGVDILQPGHRYSVVWPSIHPSGEMYCWYTPSGSTTSQIPHISDLATLPWKWVDYLRKPEHTTPKPAFNTLISHETGTYDTRMCKAINTFLNKTLSNPASKGSRHDTTLQAVWALVNFAQEGHRGALDAINQLKPRFIAEIAPDRPGKEREAAREWAAILSGAMEKVNGIQSHADPCEQSKIERMLPGEFNELTQNTIANQMGESHPQQVQNVGTTPVQTGSTTASQVQNGSTESYEANKTSSSWRFEDLTQLASGVELPPTPTVFQREDGQGLFYRGAVNDLHGEPGCGKSMIAQIAAAQELKSSHDVIYIDYEDSARNVVKRLLLLGVTGEQIVAHFHYVRPSAKPSSPTSLDGWRETLGYADTATLTVIDGVTSCLAYAGLDSNSGDDIAAWYNTMPRLILACGPAVVLIDHVVKSKDNRGRYAGGSMQKLALIDGISYSANMTKPVGKGVRGTIVIKSGKDRISEIEEHCAVSWDSNGSHLREAARIEINSTNPKLMHVTIARPNMMPSEDRQTKRDDFRPTGLMEKISQLVENAIEEPSQSELFDALKSDGSGAKTAIMSKAIRLLLEEGYVTNRASRHNRACYRSARPYRQIDDPKSDSFVDRMSREEVSELDDGNHLDI
ncbi:bifunctional DNA primase/polymerase [Bifidobacterium longum]|uniref:DNA repair and recombination protein RadB n=2 Tax=Bifidobacterium longum subsp. infantis TaxID=1682 RepID=A0ABP1X9D2_BIFLI|nr:bifunctional DNA primase/polymerase [Bifidobacterium longum]ACJ52218.1 pancreatic ribonuclease [Bifidobacterium longum subsp. infantis ATCC 15697 = JCM 1222 = DSM 20088]MBX4249128.1 bifunctional DNA primase/polymerase [Bifidobacterium longum subsp. infantis]MEE4090493.1 bifunctional DNA primase/polymerase [Bifidobacterium longum subsp. infantis]CEE97763.1 DNA repair and recombination protein RadB [Bifidobacterium longum subsp. infantis]CEF00090.1 DNA repair and recombination protein RadB [B